MISNLLSKSMTMDPATPAGINTHTRTTEPSGEPKPSGEPNGEPIGEPEKENLNPNIQFHSVTKEQFYSKDWKPSDSNSPAGMTVGSDYVNNPGLETLLSYSEGVMQASYTDGFVREQFKQLWMMQLQMGVSLMLEERGGFQNYMNEISKELGGDVIPDKDGNTCQIISYVIQLGSTGNIATTSWEELRLLIAKASIRSGHCIEMLEEIGDLATTFCLPTAEGCVCQLTNSQREEQAFVFKRRQWELEREAMGKDEEDNMLQEREGGEEDDEDDDEDDDDSDDEDEDEDEEEDKEESDDDEESDESDEDDEESDSESDGEDPQIQQHEIVMRDEEGDTLWNTQFHPNAIL